MIQYIKKNALTIAIATALVILIASCTGTAPLHKNGTYTVTKVISQQPGSSIVLLKGYRQQYHFLTDTLKPGDKVFKNVLTVKSNKINVTIKK